MAATNRARTLRRRSTDAERLLWHHLRGRQLAGLKFRRQHVLGPYIVDFICLERNLIIEVDGGQHAVQPERDARRDAWLAEQGYRVLRFWNHEVHGNIEGVLETVAETARSK
ncbi:MAG: endonuclease domain-containing protein [Proteobacteria bacterium]|nr:endonuclease domain-containing protein [Pseudomonadota bacterium]